MLDRPFERLKNMLNGLSLAYKYGDILRSLTSAWATYPGVEVSEDLRLWVRPLLLDVATLTSLTPTPIDDTVVFTAIRLVDNNRTWTAIHALVMLGYDGGFTDGVLIPQDQQVASTSELFTAISSEVPENPTIVLSAIGLMIYLLRKRKQGT